MLTFRPPKHVTGPELERRLAAPKLDLSCLDAGQYAHTNWAFDTAGALLDDGASEMVEFMRRAEIPTVNPALLSAIQAYRDVDLDVTALDLHAALQAAPAA